MHRNKRPWLANRGKVSKLAPGQPHANSLLTDALELKICNLTREGLTFSAACKLCGISLATLEDWKSKGACLPKSRYARLLEKRERAVIERERVPVDFIASDLDWKARRWLLMNWHPTTYKDRWYQELSGPMAVKFRCRWLKAGLSLISQWQPSRARSRRSLRFARTRKSEATEMEAKRRRERRSSRQSLIFNCTYSRFAALG
jgi:hypothetical protein